MHTRVRSLSLLDIDGNCGFSVGLFMFHLNRIIPVPSEKKDFILTRFLSSSSFRSVQFRPGTHTNREERKKDRIKHTAVHRKTRQSCSYGNDHRSGSEEYATIFVISIAGNCDEYAGLNACKTGTNHEGPRHFQVVTKYIA